MHRRPPPTLRAQAIAWLAQRDHSEQELRRKLMRWLSLHPVAGRDAHADPDPDPDPDPDTAVAQVLDWLRGQGYLDDQRFAAGRVDLRAARFGLSRIRNELAQLGVALGPAEVEQLRTTELQRAQALWAQRFGQPASDPRGLARQARFLSGRGFSGEVIHRVLRLAGQALPADRPAQAPVGRTPKRR